MSFVHYDKNHSKHYNTIHYKFRFGDGVLTYERFIDALKKSDPYATKIVEQFQKALEESNREQQSYFWECPPVSRGTLHHQFEFTTIRAPKLSSISEDLESFAEHFKECKDSVCSFANLGRDAVLISPRPLTTRLGSFSHLAKFVEYAKPELQFDLWKKVAEELDKSLRDGKPRWLSTNGMGVHYLHIRIDCIPKYYQWEPYRNPYYIPPMEQPSSEPRHPQVWSFSSDNVHPETNISKPNEGRSYEPQSEPASASRSFYTSRKNEHHQLWPSSNQPFGVSEYNQYGSHNSSNTQPNKRSSETMDESTSRVDVQDIQGHIDDNCMKDNGSASAANPNNTVTSGTDDSCVMDNGSASAANPNEAVASDTSDNSIKDDGSAANPSAIAANENKTSDTNRKYIPRHDYAVHRL